MAEVLGVVASGISIGSLAIQLFESLQKIHRFWKLVDGAPKYIGDLIEELQVLGSVIADLANQPEITQNLPSNSLQVCLKSCCKVLDELEPIVQQLHNDAHGSKHRKQWATIKFALKKGDLQDLTQRLERSKSTLGIAINLFNILLHKQQMAVLTQLSLAQQAGKHDRTTQVSFGEGAELVECSANKICSSTHKRVANLTSKRVSIGVGWFHYQSKIRANRSHSSLLGDLSFRGNNDDDREIEMAFFAASWFGTKGFFFHAARTWGAWQYNLRPTRVVTDYTAFLAAYQGNIPLLIDLLEGRKATIHDVGKTGWSALHFAAYGQQYRTCQWLLEQGVVGNADYTGITPLHVSTMRQGHTLHNSEDHHNTTRVLLEKGQQDPMAIDKQGFSPLHYYTGPLETLKYLVNQQNRYHVELEQRDERSREVIHGMLASSIYNGRSNGLHLIRYFWEEGRIKANGYWVRQIFNVLGHLIDNPPTDTNLTIPDLVGMNDLVSWLAGLAALIPSRSLCGYLPYMLAYHCRNFQDPTDYKEKDRTSLIRLWMAVLQEAKINLHDHFRNMEENLDLHQIPDIIYYRQGIKRIVEVEYGSDPADVIVLVRDVRVEIPPEEHIPGAWNTRSIAKGLEPAANWRVSSKEDQIKPSSTKSNPLSPQIPLTPIIE